MTDGQTERSNWLPAMRPLETRQSQSACAMSSRDSTQNCLGSSVATRRERQRMRTTCCLMTHNHNHQMRSSVRARRQRRLVMAAAAAAALTLKLLLLLQLQIKPSNQLGLQEQQQQQQQRAQDLKPYALSGSSSNGGGSGELSDHQARQRLLHLSGNGGSSSGMTKQIAPRSLHSTHFSNSYTFGSAVAGGGHQAQSSSAHSVQSPDAPKLIPLSALDRYEEGTDLRLFCSASAPKSAGRLSFEWRKNQNELLSSGLQGDVGGSESSAQEDADEEEAEEQSQQQVGNNNNKQQLQQAGATASSRQAAAAAAAEAAASTANKRRRGRRLQISMMDESASVLRIAHLEADDAGNYTCLVRNQQGSDSSTVRVNVLVKMKWIAEPPGELQVSAGKFVQLECDASGQPAPLISWTSLKDHRTINSKLLRIDRVTTNDSGMYECKATAPQLVGQQQHQQHQQQQQAYRGDHGSGEQLRKLVRLIVNGMTIEERKSLFAQNGDQNCEAGHANEVIGETAR